MKYLICQDWSNTKDNHAGMKHMCNLLKKNYPNDYEVIIFPDLISQTKINNKIVRKGYNYLLRKVIVPYKYSKISRDLAVRISNKDIIYLLEYCEKMYPQISFAKKLKRKVSNVEINALVHLVPQKLRHSFDRKELLKWINSIDNILTLGTSLTEYFIEQTGIDKIKTLFHYVDLDYYKPKERITNNYPKVIIMGNQKRNFDLLHEIVTKNPKINFTICQGILNLESKFENCSNVNLIGFVDEDVLLTLMQESDISLNIMEDTIGSNVITSSMAVGLAMIVSDIGSIRDYCDNTNSIFCENSVNSFSDALNELIKDRSRLERLKSNSIIKSQQFSIYKLNELLKLSI